MNRMLSEDMAGWGTVICLSWSEATLGELWFQGSDGSKHKGVLIWDSNGIFWAILPTLLIHKSLHWSPV